MTTTPPRTLASATPAPPEAIAWLDRTIEKYRLAPEGAHARAIREALVGRAAEPTSAMIERAASPDVGRIAELEAKLKTTRNTALINLLAAKNAIARAEAAEAEAAKSFAAGAEQMRSACLTAIRSIRHDAQDTEFDVGFEAFRVIALGTLRANLLAVLSAEAKSEGGA